MIWHVLLLKEVQAWLLELGEKDPDSAHQVEQAIDVLRAEGPALGRPLVDRVKTSRFHNMKELRPGSTGRSEIRLLFAFDPRRDAVVLVAGDKSGRWDDWYEHHVPLADRRFDEHLSDRA